MVKDRRFAVRTARLLTAVVLCAAILLGWSYSPQAEASAAGFYVSGTTICDANGNAFVMRGVNVPHAWFTSQTAVSLSAIADKGANTVRVVLSDGDKYARTSASELQSIIDLCKANKLICVAEVHDATGSDNSSDLNKAVNYWLEMKQILNSNKEYVIVNIANEWYGSWNGSAWADGYKSAISTLRSGGIKNMLMVDCAGWGQYPDSIKNYGREVFNSDEDRNTVFSIHMYEYAGGSSSTVKANINNALGIGVPVVIGEFGNRHTGGDVDEAAVMSCCTQKNVGYLGWSWKGNSSDVSYLDISNDWAGQDLTDWGDTLFNGANGIAQTSSLCSVYTGGSDSSGGDDSYQAGQFDTEILFSGAASASNWGQAVSVMTTKNGGSFNPGIMTADGYFYVEYSGDSAELIMQSWSGGSEWAKVTPAEIGAANGHSYAKYSYSSCVAAFGSDNFSGLLDNIHVGATSGSVTVYSLEYRCPI